MKFLRVDFLLLLVSLVPRFPHWKGADWNKRLKQKSQYRGQCLINDQLEPGGGTEGQGELQKGNLDKSIYASQARLDIYVGVQRRVEPVLILC